MIVGVVSPFLASGRTQTTPWSDAVPISMPTTMFFSFLVVCLLC
jgi:hypothetical protein